MFRSYNVVNVPRVLRWADDRYKFTKHHVWFDPETGNCGVTPLFQPPSAAVLGEIKLSYPKKSFVFRNKTIGFVKAFPFNFRKRSVLLPLICPVNGVLLKCLREYASLTFQPIIQIQPEENALRHCPELMDIDEYIKYISNERD